MAKKAKQEVLDESKKAKKAKSDKEGFGKKFTKFFKDTGKELKRINWPTGMVVLKNTVVVLIVVALAGVIIYGFDFGMSSGLKAVKKAADNHTSASETVEGETKTADTSADASAVAK